MRAIHYRQIDGQRGFWSLAALLAALLAAGLTAAFVMEHEGHIITGMSNQIVWGLPHVFAVFLIVAASGALNVASIASVFAKTAYKPLARLSGLLAIALLMGGLAVLVLDLGRPDRLGVAMTHYNFLSIFAWNIFLYTGFMAVTGLYLWVMMERRLNDYTRMVGTAAFLWRLILTTGTGSIFGFLAARQPYDEAIMAPLFIAMSFSFGLAIFLLVLMAACKGSGRPLGDALLMRLKNLLGVFAGGVLYFLLAFHLTKLYAAKFAGAEAFLLLNGGIYTFLFWFGAVVLGGLLPMLLFWAPQTKQSRGAVVAGSVSIILGGLALIYDIIIGGQAWPLSIFPGMAVSSPFADGAIGSYTPSLTEAALGLGGAALALFITLFALKLMPFLPETLADEEA
ncbi:MAG: polysulfide reductase NrfD [Pseudomonadota bacterium]|nr:polysulfide reductase NrfD [Pseudomonadota bacterium]